MSALALVTPTIMMVETPRTNQLTNNNDSSNSNKSLVTLTENKTNIKQTVKLGRSQINVKTALSIYKNPHTHTPFQIPLETPAAAAKMLAAPETRTPNLILVICSEAKPKKNGKTPGVPNGKIDSESIKEEET